METAQTVLEFWIGNSDSDDAAIARKNAQLWWKKDAETDARIRDRFGFISDQAAGGELEHWADTPRGRLALIILVDQFRRNIHRDTAQAFSADAMAQRWCLGGLAQGDDQALRPVERVFFYMPLEHAEDLPLQDHCVALFERLLASVEESQRGAFERFLEYARRHREIIQRFGRFPHRNGILGRKSTLEERDFLEQPGSSF